MEERVEDYIKRIESIIATLSDHIEFEDYDEDVLKEASEDKEAIENLLKRYKELEEENKRLKEYIFVAPNLDEMTAVKYSHIQRDGYIRGRAEEQEKVKQIIYENYIPISVIQNKIDKIQESMNKANPSDLYYIEYCEDRIIVLKELLNERK